jgi:hypothetical protein
VEKVDVSAISAPITTSRFEQDFFAMDTTDLMASEARIRAKYGPFYDDYIAGIMSFGRSGSRLDTAGHDPHIDIMNFLRSPSDRSLYDTVEKQYKDVTDMRKEYREQ